MTPSRFVATAWRPDDALTLATSGVVGAALIITFVNVTAASNAYPEPLGSVSLAKFPDSLANSTGVNASVVAGE